ncbi:hypothetical protein GUJ93_ZPchr0010g9779 [Zizania palustris]|uniref:Uncharacterized protein n=1 Tax=Zizania palustris TaxID=103762 RepID=A0A8J5WCQ2_ZIZPA|nr:hypothetical protein GUJ93_ZPchr0010g9779 [Zizania palustris]
MSSSQGTSSFARWPLRRNWATSGKDHTSADPQLSAAPTFRHPQRRPALPPSSTSPARAFAAVPCCLLLPLRLTPPLRRSSRSHRLPPHRSAPLLRLTLGLRCSLSLPSATLLPPVRSSD